MKKIDLLFNIVIVFSIIVFCLIFNYYLMIIFNSKKIIHHNVEAIPTIEVKDTEADWTTVRQPQLKFYTLDRDLSYFPAADEMTSLFMIYSALGIDYYIDDFYDIYFDSFELEGGTVSGVFSPELLWAVSNSYFDEYYSEFRCENLSNKKEVDIFRIAENHYPILVWYDYLYDGTPDYAWQYVNTLIIYDASGEFIFCKNNEGSDIRIKYDTFKEHWEMCGRYALVFGKCI